MKKKGNAKSTRIQIAFIIFAIGLLVALPIRVYQMMNIVEAETGFYSKIDFSVPLLYVVLGVISLLCLVFTFISGKFYPSHEPKGKRVTLSVVSFLTAGTLLWDAVLRSGDVISKYFDFENTLDTTTQKYITENGLIPLSLQALFAVLASMYFLIFGLTYLVKKVNYESHKILALTPLAWAMARIILRFMRTISFVNVSELLFELCMLAMLMLFFMAFARVSSKVNESMSMVRLYGFGLISALLAFLCSVPRIVLVIIGRSEMLVAQSPIEWCDFAIGLFIVIYLINSLELVKKGPVKVSQSNPNL